MPLSFDEGRLILEALECLMFRLPKWGEGRNADQFRARIVELRTKLNTEVMEPQPDLDKYCCFNRECWNKQYFHTPNCPKCSQPGTKQLRGYIYGPWLESGPGFTKRT